MKVIQLFKLNINYTQIWYTFVLFIQNLHTSVCSENYHRNCILYEAESKLQDNITTS